MNFKTTIILILLLGIAGVYLAWDRFSTTTSKPNTDSELVDGKGRKLFDVDSSAVARVSIKSADGSTLTVARAGENWEIVEPLRTSAETWAVDGLVRGILDLRSRGSVDASARGLTPARYVVEMLTSDNRTIRLQIGNKSSLGDVMYVQRDGQAQADVVPADLYAQLGKSPDELRNKQIVQSVDAEIRQVTITQKDEEVSLEKTGDAWTIVAPTPAPADAAAAASLAGALRSLRAVEFVSADDPSLRFAGFDDPTLVVTYSTALPATRPATSPTAATSAPVNAITSTPATAPSLPGSTTLTFGGFDDLRKQNVFVRINADTFAKVSAASLEPLKKSALDLRDKKVVDIDPESVAGVSVVEHLQATTQPTTRSASSQTREITRRALEATLGPATPATQPTAAVSTAPSTLPTPSTLPAAVASPPASKWQVAGDASLAVDDVKIDALLSSLHPLTATRFVKADEASVGMDTYVVTISTIQRGGAGTTHVLQVTGSPDNTLTATCDGLRFELPADFLAKIKALFDNP